MGNTVVLKGETLQCNDRNLRADGSIIRGDRNNIQGNGNTIIGNSCKIRGNGNCIQGTKAVVNGNGNNIGLEGEPLSECIVEGNSNFAFSQKSKIKGNSNHIRGNQNEIRGNSNNIRGNQNTIEGNSNSIIGDNNSYKGNQNSTQGNYNLNQGRSNPPPQGDSFTAMFDSLAIQVMEQLERSIEEGADPQVILEQIQGEIDRNMREGEEALQREENPSFVETVERHHQEYINMVEERDHIIDLNRHFMSEYSQRPLPPGTRAHVIYRPTRPFIRPPTHLIGTQIRVPEGFGRSGSEIDLSFGRTGRVYEPNPNKKEEKKKEEKRKEAPKDEETDDPKQECVVCKTNKKIMLCTPCNHLCLCYGCSQGVGGICPLCRKTVEDFKQVFM